MYIFPVVVYESQGVGGCEYQFESWCSRHDHKGESLLFFEDNAIEDNYSKVSKS